MFDLTEFLLELVIIAPIVLIALSFHEWAHGFVAYKLGDPTAKYLGRLTLNPIKHIDPIGALCMLLAHFGWAKPVPIDITNFKHPKRDLALSAMAGPVVNVLLGIVGCFLYVVAINFIPYNFESAFLTGLVDLLFSFLFYFGVLNFTLSLFNFLPIPPLDGSKILYAFLPPAANNWCKMHEREISVGFFALLFIDYRILDGALMGFLYNGVSSIFFTFASLFNLLLSLFANIFI